MKMSVLFFLVFWVPGMAAAQVSGSMHNVTFHLGVSVNSFGPMNRNDTIAALKAWSMAIAKERDLFSNLEVTVFENIGDIQQALREKRVDGLTLTTEEFQQLGEKPETVFLPIMDSSLELRYALLVRQDSGVTRPGDLHGGKLIVPWSPRMSLAVPWLESVLKKRLSKEPLKVENSSKAILQVYFRQAQAALVTSEAFQVACELNPQLHRELSLISISPPFLAGVFMLRPSFQEPWRDGLETAITKMHDTPSGRQVLTVFQCARMERHSGAVLQPTLDFLAEHRRLIHVTSFRGARP